MNAPWWWRHWTPKYVGKSQWLKKCVSWWLYLYICSNMFGSLLTSFSGIRLKNQNYTNIMAIPCTQAQHCACRSHRNIRLLKHSKKQTPACDLHINQLFYAHFIAKYCHSACVILIFQTNPWGWSQQGSKHVGTRFRNIRTFWITTVDQLVWICT
jgi:hypothetical protein